MGSSVKQIQFLILSILISTALCYTNHGSIASGSVLKSFPDDDGGGTPALKFVYTIEDPETKIPCTMANMSLSIVVNYTTKQQMVPMGASGTVTFNIDDAANSAVVKKQVKIPSNAVVKGACGPMVSEMSLLWKTWEDDKFQENVVKFVLFNDRTNFSVFSIDVDLFLDPDSFPDATDERRTTRSDIDLGLFDAPVEDGLHKCHKERRIKIDNDTALITSDVSFIAFNTKKDYGQRKEMICDDDANTKVFPFRIQEKRYGVALLARMSFNVEIPYLTKNDTIAKYTVQIPTRDSDSILFRRIYKNTIDDSLSGYMSLYLVQPNVSSIYHINFYFNQDIDGVAYISRVEFDVTIPKKVLPDAKYAVMRNLEMRLVLFPTPSDSGIFSCSRGMTLYMDDIRLQITDVLLVMFDKTGDFSSKHVIECNTKPKLTKEDFTYAVQEKNGAVPCILANMSISMRIPYKMISVANPVYTNITVPTNATANGFCGPSLSKIELTWPAEDSQLNSVAFYLSRESNFSMFHLETNIYMDNTSFPNISDWFAHQWEVYRSNFSLGMFVGPKDNGWYNCLERQEIIRDGSTTITISNVSLIAFNDQEDLSIKKAYACSNDEKKNTTIQPHPSEAAFKYVVRNEDKNIACILANMTISVKVAYKTKSRSDRETTFVVPKDGVNVTGNCDCRIPELTLTWLPKGAVPDPEQPYKTRNSISLTFSGDYLKFYVSMVKVGFYLDENNFPDALESRYTITERKQDLFTSYISNLYKCNLETVVELKNVQLTFNDIALTAFNNYRNVSHLRVDECCCIASTGISSPIVLASVFGGLLIGYGLVVIIYACRKHYRKRYSSVK